MYNNFEMDSNPTVYTVYLYDLPKVEFSSHKLAYALYIDANLDTNMCQLIVFRMLHFILYHYLVYLHTHKSLFTSLNILWGVNTQKFDEPSHKTWRGKCLEGRCLFRFSMCLACRRMWSKQPRAQLLCNKSPYLSTLQTFVG